MDARDEILTRIGRALGDARGRDVPIPRDYVRHLDLPRPDVIELFIERVADYTGEGGPPSAGRNKQSASGATVRHIGADELGTAVAAALWGRQTKRIVVPADLPFGWLSELQGVDALADAPPLDTDQLAGMDGVVTGCALAIAQTGTIILDGGRGQGRRALTLVPDYHLCVVHADQIVGTVSEAIARADPYRPLTWISGPSATSDIELRRVSGVHGPRTLEVLVVEE